MQRWAMVNYPICLKVYWQIYAILELIALLGRLSLCFPSTNVRHPLL